jgi:hypothetical protein
MYVCMYVCTMRMPALQFVRVHPVRLRLAVDHTYDATRPDDVYVVVCVQDRYVACMCHHCWYQGSSDMHIRGAFQITLLSIHMHKMDFFNVDRNCGMRTENITKFVHLVNELKLTNIAPREYAEAEAGAYTTTCNVDTAITVMVAAISLIDIDGTIVECISLRCCEALTSNISKYTLHNMSTIVGK